MGGKGDGEIGGVVSRLAMAIGTSSHLLHSPHVLVLALVVLPRVHHEFTETLYCEGRAEEEGNH